MNAPLPPLQVKDRFCLHDIETSWVKSLLWGLALTVLVPWRLSSSLIRRAMKPELGLTCGRCALTKSSACFSDQSCSPDPHHTKVSLASTITHTATNRHPKVHTAPPMKF